MKSTIRDGHRRALALVLTALVLAIGFCVLEGDAHHETDHADFDRCLGMLAVMVTITLLTRLPLAGFAATDCLTPSAQLSLLVPAPPPKSCLL